MRLSGSILVKTFFIVYWAAVLLFAASCTLIRGRNDPPRPSFSCMNAPELLPNLPGDVDLPNHANVQCFAWQQFIALNWPAKAGRAGEADPAQGAAQFGEPLDRAPVVWETYKEAHEVFLPGGAVPPAWGASGLRKSLPSLRFAAGAQARTDGKQLEELKQSDGLMIFRMNNMVSPRAQRLHRFLQAGGGWLTAQNGKLAHYGIHINKDEFDYIVANQLYDAREQSGRAISLPAGRSVKSPAGASEGSIEIKSAWVEITDPAKRNRFRTVEACIVENDRCRNAVVGLVGLHIIRKTETFPQWAWATFEHVDNAPDREEVRQGQLDPSYTFHDPNCGGAPHCAANRFPASTDPMDQPMQVVRQTPLAPSAKLLNQRMQRMIRDANPDSVWQHYQLVDVQWPEAGEIIAAPANAPLPMGGPTPTSLANTMIETYVQHQHCLECHREARIACSSRDTTMRVASDYSFLFTMASEPNPPAACAP